MTPLEELDLILKLIRKYDLPLSPILEYAVTEKKEENTANLPKEVTDVENISETSVFGVEAEPSNTNIVDFNIPENADTTTRNKYLMQFCYGILSEFEGALDDREKNICKRLLVENRKRRASEEYHITDERVRQIFVKSINKISEAHNAAMQELEALRQENEDLTRRNCLLEEEMKKSSNFDKVLSLQELEDSLCYNAKRLLVKPNSEIPFSNRTTNILRAAKVVYFKDIPQLSLEEVQKLRNCGRKTITELREFMGQYSLDFGMTYENIVSCLSKFVDSDFDSSLLAHYNSRNYWKKANTSDESIQEDNPKKVEGSEEDEEPVVPNKEEVEHVFLSSKDAIDGTSKLSICSENRSGKPWSSEEEALITDYYNQGQSFYAIAKAVGRTEVAVMSRLGMLGVIDYSYGQEYKPKEDDVSCMTDRNDEETEFNGTELAERYYYPLQDNLFWDENTKQVYEMYLADNYDLILNHLIFNLNELNELEAKAEGLSDDDKEDLYSTYWHDNHINIIARIKPNTEGYEALKLDSGTGIQEIVYEPGKYTSIKYIEDEKEIFIDYNGSVYDSFEQIAATTNIEVARYHKFFEAPRYITKEYIRLGMIEIKRVYKGAVKKVTIYADSELGQVIKNNSEEVWMLDLNVIVTKTLTDEDNTYPFKVYFCNGVKADDGDMETVREKSLVLQNQLKERINKLHASLKKNKERIRYERQFKEIISSLFVFADKVAEGKDSKQDNEEL
ncbi:MAG: hypothetical protein J6N21_01530 [Butyrivibrio sp.]|nr:hypothetical protein [Butyrivibrio sp.]